MLIKIKIMQQKRIIDLLETKPSPIEITINGWVRAFRSNRFIALNDGSTIKNLQCVVNFENFEESLLKKITDSYTAQTTDVSYGRTYDASPNWVTFITATPDASNGVLDLEEQQGPGLTIFPNPHSGEFTLDNTWPTAMTVRFYTMQGKLIDVISLEGFEQLKVSDLRYNQPIILHYSSEMGSGYLKLIAW